MFCLIYTLRAWAGTWPGIKILNTNTNMGSNVFCSFFLKFNFLFILILWTVLNKVGIVQLLQIKKMRSCFGKKNEANKAD